VTTLPQYKYGKVSGLAVALTVVSERGESPMVCCGYCSAQMACITAVAGVSNLMRDEAHAMRACCGRPHNNGNRASELRDGAWKAVGVKLEAVDIADIPARLRAGYAVTVGLQYKDLPPYLKVQTNDFGHAACLYGWDGNKVGYFDPIWTQGSSGAWALWDDVKDALWGNGNHSTTVIKRSDSTGGGGDMGIYFNPAQWKASKDIPVFLDSNFAKQITTIKKGGIFCTIGAKAVVDADGRDSSARAVLVSTGGLIPGTGEAAQKAILWAKGADFPPDSQPTEQAWDDSVWRLALDPKGRYPAPTVPPVVPPVDPDADCADEVTAAIMQRDQEWEDALKGGEPWPGQ
jgi:hypothetical protein